MGLVLRSERWGEPRLALFLYGNLLFATEQSKHWRGLQGIPWKGPGRG